MGYTAGVAESDATETAGHKHAQARTREEAWGRHPSRRNHAVLEPETSRESKDSSPGHTGATVSGVGRRLLYSRPGQATGRKQRML